MQFRINHPLCQLNDAATKKIQLNWRIRAFRPGIEPKNFKKVIALQRVFDRLRARFQTVSGKFS
jgi:hypothetical protein